MIAEEERLLKLRQLRQLHDVQEYQDLVALQRRSGSIRAPDFVTVAPPVTLLEASNPTSMPELADGADDSITAAIAATITTNTTTTTTKTSTTATTSITEASVPTPPEEEEEEETLSSHKRKSKKKDTKWLVTLGELKKYRQANGDCIVPRGYALNTRLASWVAEQRLVSKIR
jgi:cell division septation protein DedD